MRATSAARPLLSGTCPSLLSLGWDSLLLTVQLDGALAVTSAKPSPALPGVPTIAQAAGLPQYGIMIGLLDGGTPIAGGIIAPAYDKLYLAEKGKGATCNGKPIHATSEPELLNVLVLYGIDGHQEDPERTMNECRVMADIILGCRNMRNTGCEALDPMYVAEGRYGGRVNTTSKIWDNVAPQIIAEEAGAVWTSANGTPTDYSNPLSRIDQNFTFCVAAPVLHRQLQAIIAGRL